MKPVKLWKIDFIKNTFKYIIILSIAAILCFSFYHIGYKNGGINALATGTIDYDAYKTIGKIDYPLIEVAFGNGSEWLVIDLPIILYEQANIKTSQNSALLDFYKDKLRVLTFPVGRGTTPNGIICIYKNGMLIKYVPYLEIYFDSNELENSFQSLPKDEVEALIIDELPPRI
jgi:hypothetical protein